MTDVTSDLLTLPGMTADAARRLDQCGLGTRARLHKHIAYAPGVVALVANTSMQRVELWLADLERDTQEVQP